MRELENAIEHGFALCRRDLIDVDCLPLPLRPGHAADPGAGLTLEEIEEHAIHDALRRHQGKKVAAARELGINKTTLWRKMRRHGLQPERG